jgi:pilus assembly protein CpaB
VARRTLLIIASILLAALGTALIWLYVQGAENRAQQNAELVPALFLTANVPAGQSPAKAVKVEAVPPAVAANAVTSTQELGTQTLRVDGIAGQVLLKTMLSSSGTSVGRFPEGSGAASVTITDPNRVPADLKPGDTVDIVELSKDNAKIADGLVNVTVRSIGAAQAGSGTTTTGGTGTAQNGALPATIVGLNVTSDQAVLLYSIVAKGDQVALYLHDRK